MEQIITAYRCTSCKQIKAPESEEVWMVMKATNTSSLTLERLPQIALDVEVEPDEEVLCPKCRYARVTDWMKKADGEEAEESQGNQLRG